MSAFLEETNLPALLLRQRRAERASRAAAVSLGQLDPVAANDHGIGDVLEEAGSG